MKSIIVRLTISQTQFGLRNLFEQLHACSNESEQRLLILKTLHEHEAMTLHPVVAATKKIPVDRSSVKAQTQRSAMNTSDIRSNDSNLSANMMPENKAGKKLSVALLASSFEIKPVQPAIQMPTAKAKPTVPPFKPVDSWGPMSLEGEEVVAKARHEARRQKLLGALDGFG